MYRKLLRLYGDLYWYVHWDVHIHLYADMCR